MADNIDTNNSKIYIDEEVGSGGSYNINGHNNNIKLSGITVSKIVVMGHNNIIRGTGNDEAISKLTVLGHNNVINRLLIKNLEICGHNNCFKNLHLTKQPVNNGFSNKFSNVDLVEVQHEDSMHGKLI